MRRFSKDTQLSFILGAMIGSLVACVALHVPSNAEVVVCVAYWVAYFYIVFKR